MVTLAEGEKINDVEVRFFRPGVVTGQVRDERGDGVEGISISLVRIISGGGRRSLGLPRSTTTDDRGVFRMAGVPPGDYGVCALFRPAHCNRSRPIWRRRLAAPTRNARSRDRADSRRPVRAIALADLVLISGSGQRNVDPAPREDGRFSVFADVCYPSAPGTQEMEIVRVDSGQERAQLDLVLRVVPSVRISGTLVAPANRLSGMAGTSIRPLRGCRDQRFDVVCTNGDRSSRRLRPSSACLRVHMCSAWLTWGCCSVNQLGMAELVNRLAAQGQPVPPELMAMAAQRANTPDEPTLWATAPITIGETDVSGVTLSLREGPRMTGTIVFDGSKEKPPATQLTSASFILESTRGRWRTHSREDDSPPTRHSPFRGLFLALIWRVRIWRSPAGRSNPSSLAVATSSTTRSISAAAT
jgi:hypothetical protein